MTWLLRYSGILAIGVAIALYWRELGIPIFLVVMGGALAYLGDQLGVYWGKKRISIFGLRPKQTAVVISVVTGLLITLLTLMVASYLNDNVKIALFEIDTLLEKQSQLRATQKQILKKSKDLEGQNHEIQKENLLLQREKSTLEGVKASLLDEKRELEKKITEVEESLLNLREDKQRKIVEIERLAKIVEKKETALVAIHKGQPLIETPVILPLDSSDEEISRVSLTMLADLKEAVESKGVNIDTDAFVRAERTLTQSILQELGKIRETFAHDGPVVTECCIQPVSLRNVSIDEKLQAVKFQVKPNILVFGKDEEVARTSIDGRLAEERVLDQLFYFDKQVISVLREKGVSHTSLRIRERKISSRQLVNFYRIVRLVRELGRPVLVRFVTQSPVYSYGEINAVYKVEELPGPWSPKGRELGSTVASVVDTVPSTAAAQSPTIEAVTPTTLPTTGPIVPTAAATVAPTTPKPEPTKVPQVPVPSPLSPPIGPARSSGMAPRFSSPSRSSARSTTGLLSSELEEAISDVDPRH